MCDTLEKNFSPRTCIGRLKKKLNIYKLLLICDNLLNLFITFYIAAVLITDFSYKQSYKRKSFCSYILLLLLCNFFLNFISRILQRVALT